MNHPGGRTQLKASRQGQSDNSSFNTKYQILDTSHFSIVILLNLICVLISYSLTYLFTRQILPISGFAFWVFIISLALLNVLILPYAKRLNQSLSWFPAASYLIIYALLLSAILYTKSRSGVLALFVSMGVFWVGWILEKVQGTSFKVQGKTFYKPLLLTTIYLLLIFIIGTEFTPSLKQLTAGNASLANSTSTLNSKSSPVTPTLPHPESISESTDIRRVVWQGAVDLWKQYPVFGTGTETFAYAYYQVRPLAHNHLSEWDFLYNKAHNEYLNLLANNGAAGAAGIFLLILGTYWFLIRASWKAWFKVIVSLGTLALLGWVIVPTLFNLALDKLLIYPPLLIPLGISVGLAGGQLVFLQRYNLKSDIKAPNDLATNQKKTYAIGILPVPHDLSGPLPMTSYTPAMLASLTTILITNFYGFSVVTVSLMFFLLAAFWVVFTHAFQPRVLSITWPSSPTWKQMSTLAMAGLLITGGLTLWNLLGLYSYFKADTYYSIARAYHSQGGMMEANRMIDQALNLRQEADYLLQKAMITAQTSFVLYNQEGTASASLTKKLNDQALLEVQHALALNPVHLNHYKNSTKVFLTLALIDPTYYQLAIKTLQAAQKLAPTDPQLTLNLALIYEELDQRQPAIGYYEATTTLKPNYRRAWIRFAQFYQAQQNEEKAKEIYQWILDNIDPKDVTSLRELKALNVSLLPNR